MRLANFKHTFISAIVLFLLVTTLQAERISIDANAITKTHNDLRSLHHIKPLVYTQTLEKAALQWAKKLAKDGCHMVHSHGKVGPYGENLYWASAHKRATSKDAKGAWIWHASLQKVEEKAVVQAWYDEIKYYDYETNSCQEGEMCGHFTQVLWSTTTSLGCAAMSCKDASQVWVCEYVPAGNITLQTTHTDGTQTTERLKPY